MKDAGFTLIELLITMTLLALLSLVLFGGFRFGTRAWDRTEGSAAATAEIRRAQDAITETLGRAYPEMQFTDPKNPHVYFDGRANAVTYLGPSGDGAMAVFRLARDGDVLTMTTTPELARDPVKQTRTRKLVTNVKSFALAYYGAPNDLTPPGWSDVWANRSRLPTLVRIRATLAQARPGWTEMMVHPRIEADVACVYDALSKFCQGR
ncbi:MAG TPA: prepilin-type N-terminal cleavage/methylation domain-containing protein [Rhizomicrobium sp.]